MLGLSFEKIILIGIIAAVVIGPERLPRYAAKLGEFVRNFRDFTASTKAKAEADLGMPLDTAEWNRQIRRYDPRTVVKDALAADPATSAPQDTAPVTTGAAPATTQDAASVTTATAPTTTQDAASVTTATAPATTKDAVTTGADATDATVTTPDDPAEAPVMRERWVRVGGSSGHPKRRKILEPVPAEELAAAEAARADAAAGQTAGADRATTAEITTADGTAVRARTAGAPEASPSARVALDAASA